jgi:hypothetical protein
MSVNIAQLLRSLAQEIDLTEGSTAAAVGAHSSAGKCMAAFGCFAALDASARVCHTVKACLTEWQHAAAHFPDTGLGRISSLFLELSHPMLHGCLGQHSYAALSAGTTSSPAADSAPRDHGCSTISPSFVSSFRPLMQPAVLQLVPQVRSLLFSARHPYH